MPVRALAVLIVAIFPALAAAQLPPDKALAAFTVADGLQVELFASEPMFTNPTCIDIDEKGRVWVCESVNYRHKLHKRPPNRPEGDRIVILEDTNGDGKADKATTFYQQKDFLAPLGIAVAKDPVGPGYKVYVCHSPHIYVFEDKDGDGKADGPPKILLTGFGGVDHDHGVHGIHFGPDGKLYFSVGDQGVKNLASREASAPGGIRSQGSEVRDQKSEVRDQKTDANNQKDPFSRDATRSAGQKRWTTNQTDCKAGTIWRCNPDGTGLELLAHNFRNQYEPAVNSFGTMFVSDNDDDGNQQTRICHVMYGGDYGYWPRNPGDHHWHEDQPGIVHKVLRTGFGSPTGMCWYEGTLLQEAFSRQLSALSKNQGDRRQESGDRRKAKQELDRRKGEPGASATGGLATGGPGATGGSSASANRATTQERRDVSPPVARANAQYTGYLLHTDAGPREVRLFGVKPKGAGYELDKVNLLTSTDPWFRPSDVCVAPDGSIFVSDWYDPGVGGHGMGDTTRGRIYRITPKGHKGYALHKFNHLQHEGSHEALSSPNIATRQLALQQTNMNWVGFPIGNGSFVTSFESNPGYSERVFWAWSNSEHFIKVVPDLVASGLEMDKAFPDERNEYAFWKCMFLGERHWPDLAKLVGNNNAKSFLRLILKEKSVQLNREVLLWLRNSETEFTRSIFYDLAKQWDGQDHFYLAALNIAVGTDPDRRRIILEDFEKHFPEWNDTTARLVWELRPPRVVAKLGDRLSTQKMTPLQQELALGALAASGPDEGGGEALFRLLQEPRLDPNLASPAARIFANHLKGKWSRFNELSLFKQVFDNLLKNDRNVPALLELITAAQRTEYLGFIERVAYNSEGFPDGVRDQAIASLARFKNDQSLSALKKLLRHEATQKQAMQALGVLGTFEALAPLQAFFLGDKMPVETRRTALEVLAGTRRGATWLLETNANKKLPEAFTLEVGRLLRNSPYVDLRNKALLAFPVSTKMDLSKLPSPTVLAKRLGHAAPGRELVMNNKDLACAKCHAFQGVGGHIGPDLSMIGVKASKENLFESILTPDKAVADQFAQHVVETKAGVTLTGLLVEDSADVLVLRDANGKDTRISKADVEQQKKSDKSLMPSNLATFLTEDELIDVVTYLATLKSPALTIDRWQVIGPFPNGPKDAGLEKLHGPEVAYDPMATYKGKTGDVRWLPVNVDATGCLDLAALQGNQAKDSVSIVYAEFDLTTAGTAEIKLGPSGPVKVYVNDEVLFIDHRHEAPQPARDSITVDLRKGKNKLMIKLCNSNTPHGLYCTILGPGTEPPKLVKLP